MADVILHTGLRSEVAAAVSKRLERLSGQEPAHDGGQTLVSPGKCICEPHDRLIAIACCSDERSGGGTRNRPR